MPKKSAHQHEPKFSIPGQFPYRPTASTESKNAHMPQKAKSPVAVRVFILCRCAHRAGENFCTLFPPNHANMLPALFLGISNLLWRSNHTSKKNISFSGFGGGLRFGYPFVSLKILRRFTDGRCIKGTVENFEIHKTHLF